MHAVFKPKADLVFLTTGNSQIELSSNDSDFEVENIEFDIAKVLELNNVNISDPEGDNPILNLSLPYSSAMIMIWS